MPYSVQWPASPALVARLRAIEAAASESGRAAVRVKGDIRQIVLDDHVDMLLRGVDRYGRPRAPLAAASLENRRGTGPSLVPRGGASRYVTTFRTDWVTGTDATRILRMYYQDFTSPQGYPIPRAHETGTSRIPARPTAGITPKGWAAVVRRHEEYARAVLQGD